MFAFLPEGCYLEFVESGGGEIANHLAEGVVFGIEGSEVFDPEVCGKTQEADRGSLLMEACQGFGEVPEGEDENIGVAEKMVAAETLLTCL